MVPVLLFCFNRPDKTRIVLERLKECGVKDLYINVDALASKYDPKTRKWIPVYHTYLKGFLEQYYFGDFNVRFNWLPEHKGPSQGPIDGINWFFSQEPYGVILDDDCVPDPSFFKFAEDFLIKGFKSEKIAHISGFCPSNTLYKDFDGDSAISKIPLNWGWATWAHKWKKDLSIPPHVDIRKEIERSEFYQKGILNKWQWTYLIDKFEQVQLGNLKAWDYAWFFYIIIENKHCITSTTNLIEYIGYDFGTHTVDSSKKSPEVIPYTGTYAIQNQYRLDNKVFQLTQKSNFRLVIWLIKRFILKLIQK